MVGTPPGGPTGPTREQRLEWLEHALGEAQDIMRAMQSNGALDADLGTYVEIVRVSPLSLKEKVALWLNAVLSNVSTEGF